MLVIQSFKSRIEIIADKLEKTKGEFYAKGFYNFILNYQNGKIKNEIPTNTVLTLQYFWDDASLDYVDDLLDSDEFQAEPDLQEYLLDLRKDIKENLKLARWASDNHILF
jgi:hypothetical protein